MLVLQNNDPSLEDLSEYKKRGFEYVEEEKMVLDALVVLYQQRLEIAQNHLKALEELHSTTMTRLDPSSSLYEALVHPIIECLRKDIEGYTQYVQSTAQDLARITFPFGPRAETSNIKQDLDAVKQLYPEYSDSCTAVLKLRPPSSVKWLHDEDIKHRKITAKLHPKQKAARTHFETSYPKLLKDHMEYMEQVRRLVWDNTTRRSELSTTIACNTNAEKVLIDRFSTADAIAVPYRKLELEQSCPEYHHAPVLNPLTRNLEEGRIVILGRDIDPGSEEDIAGDLLIACLERYPPICEIGQLARGRAVHETIHRMESSQNMRDIYEIVSSLSDAEVIVLLGVILTNSRVNLPLLNLTSRKSASKLRENPWNRPALVDLMKDVNQSIKGILKACIFAYTITHHHVHIVGQILLTGKGIPSPSMDWPLECILTRWDCDAWCPLGENMVWGAKSAMGEPPTLRRMKRFPGISEDVVFLEVDEEGNIMDTPENAVKKMHINEEEQSSSSFSIKKLRKLMS